MKIIDKYVTVDIQIDAHGKIEHAIIYRTEEEDKPTDNHVDLDAKELNSLYWHLKSVYEN